MSALIILGRVLLIVLFVILALLLLILFVPISYEVHGRLSDPEGGESFDFERVKSGLSGSFHFRFLFSLVSGGISYPEGTDFVIRIAFLRINLSEKKRSKEERVETEEKPDNEAQRQLDRDLAEKERTKQEENSKGKEKAAKTPPLEKLKALLEKLPDLPDAAYDRIQEWEKKADRALKNADFYLNLISDPSSQEAVEKALSSIGKLAKHILPKNWSLTGTAGLGDPAATGELLVILAQLYPVTCGHVAILPDFDLWRADLRFEAKGHVQLIFVAAAAIRILTDRDIKRLIGRIRRHRERRKQAKGRRKAAAA